MDEQVEMVGLLVVVLVILRLAVMVGILVDRMEQ
jgi:hypothetical protein